MEEELDLQRLLNPTRVLAAQRFLIEVQGIAARYVGRVNIEWENYTLTALEQWPEIAREAEEMLRPYPHHPDASYPRRLLEAARREEIASESGTKVEVRVDGPDVAAVRAAWVEIDGCAQHLGATLEDGWSLAALPPTIVPFAQEDGAFYYRSGGRRYVFSGESLPVDIN